MLASVDRQALRSVCRSTLYTYMLYVDRFGLPLVGAKCITVLYVIITCYCIGCIDVDRSPFIYDEVKRAQENLVLANDLHLLYLVTTPDMITDIKPNWMTYLDQVS